MMKWAITCSVSELFDFGTDTDKLVVWNIEMMKWAITCSVRQACCVEYRNDEMGYNLFCQTSLLCGI